MKKVALLLLSIVLATSVMGQSKAEQSARHKELPKIEEMVNGLSAFQKKRLNSLMEDSKKEVDRLQAELEKVHKQIHALFDKDEDCSEQLFPLFDREAEIRAEISKNMYRTRIQIFDILTKEQVAEYKAAIKNECGKGVHHKTPDTGHKPAKKNTKSQN